MHKSPQIEAERWIRDPRGVMVLLSAGRWRDHVLRRHRQDMEGRYEDTIQAIAGPALITRSPRSSAIELY